jgi:hypothetical protein
MNTVLGLLVSWSKSVKTIFSVKYDVTRIVNARSVNEAIYDMIRIKHNTHMKEIILSVIKYTWMYYVIGKLNYNFTLI